MATLSVEPNPKIPCRVVLDAGDVIVVEKPSGLPTQPGKGHERDTLLNGLFAAYGSRLQNLGAARDFGLLHRLDRMASGLVVVALMPRAYDALREAFAERRIDKRYWAIVFGTPSKHSGVIRASIVEGTDARGRKVARVVRGRVRDAKPAVTAYRVISSGKQASMLECRIGTGRLHQIRAHMAALGHPVAGDDIYADPGTRRMTHRLALHAFLLGFDHPVTGEPVRVVSPWPGDLRGPCLRLGLRIPAHEEESSDDLGPPDDEGDIAGDDGPDGAEPA